MLGVSFSELIVVCIVIFIIMKPRDIRKAAYWYKYLLKKVMELRSIAQESIDEINDGLGENELKKATKQEYIIDSDRKLQKACDVNPLNKKSSKS